MSFAISTFSVTLCYELVYSTALLERELGKRLVLGSTASKSQSSDPALPTMCWVLILSGLSSLSLSSPAKPLAEEEAALAGSSEFLHRLETLQNDLCPLWCEYPTLVLLGCGPRGAASLALLVEMLW